MVYSPETSEQAKQIIPVWKSKTHHRLNNGQENLKTRTIPLFVGYHKYVQQRNPFRKQTSTKTVLVINVD
jgi:hypothetical protein